MKDLTIEHKPQKERCILVGISTPKVRPWLATEQLAELGRLAETEIRNGSGYYSERFAEHILYAL